LTLAIEAENARDACVRSYEVEQDANRGRLARAVGSKESEDLARLDAQVNAA
jgi:hypothetical protein